MARQGDDWDLCAECRFQSMVEFASTDHEYCHSELTRVHVDGSILHLDDLSLIEINEESA